MTTPNERLSQAETLQFLAAHANNPPYIPERDDSLDTMTPQACPKGVHADWAVDSEDTHTCPWCALDQARAESDKHRNERDELKKRVAELDRELGKTIDQRDRVEDVADQLAYAIAPAEAIGEHSSENDPWQNALDIVTPAAKVDELKKQVAALNDRLHDAAVTRSEPS
ncbi:hypothetical protein GCM10017744_102940 [Streptomyces antimycoticus]|uniref:Uncharacterized protein n=1 Tax=Streptomyces antimycoticus TaxID=68175 RepID=A0A4D4KSA1_9ACTN|nr:hypothetical protein [Streptomyces antimycoticus]GDY49328.1 hypothetical protein SANT12839_102100 [Streptomyces antimycoticus]